MHMKLVYSHRQKVYCINLLWPSSWSLLSTENKFYNIFIVQVTFKHTHTHTHSRCKRKGWRGMIYQYDQRSEVCAYKARISYKTFNISHNRLITSYWTKALSLSENKENFSHFFSEIKRSQFAYVISEVLIEYSGELKRSVIT